MAYVPLLAAAALIAAAVLALHHLKRVRIAVIVVEALLMAVAVVTSFASAEGEAWFTR
ncbi:hypothetical protein [Streptomyces sp. NPDC000229]|uniref:hypothetical protein n=1 Tax=Streptomyces sp. NPDC000229 TaxID=3154247 RepID=UPI003333DD09